MNTAVQILAIARDLFLLFVAAILVRAFIQEQIFSAQIRREMRGESDGRSRHRRPGEGDRPTWPAPEPTLHPRAADLMKTHLEGWRLGREYQRDLDATICSQSRMANQSLEWQLGTTHVEDRIRGQNLE